MIDSGRYFPVLDDNISRSALRRSRRCRAALRDRLAFSAHSRSSSNTVCAGYAHADSYVSDPSIPTVANKLVVQFRHVAKSFHDTTQCIGKSEGQFFICRLVIPGNVYARRPLRDGKGTRALVAGLIILAAAFENADVCNRLVLCERNVAKGKRKRTIELVRNLLCNVQRAVSTNAGIYGYPLDGIAFCHSHRGPDHDDTRHEAP